MDTSTKIVEATEFNQNEKHLISTLRDAGLAVLQTKDCFQKAQLTKYFINKWKSNEINQIAKDQDLQKKNEIIDYENEAPYRPLRPDISFYSKKQYHPKSSKHLIHSIAHAESYAIDLMWDVIVRFVKMDMPKDYYDDWANVVFEEANHFESWANRLEDPDIDGKYGGMPGSELLWDAAQETSHDLLTRLAIVNMVHEARGLDTVIQTRKKFESCQDQKSLQILETNSSQEIGHVGCAVKWFKYLCEKDNINNPIDKFQQIVKQSYKGFLTPPFNTDMRQKAGLLKEWYEPLSK